MNLAGKIACKTVGALGMSAGLYDAFRIAKHQAGIRKEKALAEHYQDVYFSSRTTDNMSYVANDIRKKTADIRDKLIFPAITGQIKGGIGGFLYGLGNWLPAIACSALALLSKGKAAIFGAAGVALCAVYSILHNGFGMNKQNPMN